MVEGLAVEAVAAQRQAFAGGSPDLMNLQQVSLPTEPLQRPSDQQAADFAGAIEGARPSEVEAGLPPSRDGLSDRISRQAEAMVSRLRLPDGSKEPSGSTMGAPTPHTASLDPAMMNDAVARMERAYMFAIETTMASRGSTESTKIFNTLLKGQ